MTTTTTTTTTTSLPTYVSFTAALTITNFSSFNLTRYSAGVATAAGLNVSAVAINSVTYKVTIEFDLGEVVMSEAEIQSSVAQANDVPAAAVNVTMGRRLVASPRRLRSVSAAIYTTDVSTAESVLATSADIDRLAAAMTNVTGNAVSLPNQTISPEASVAVVTVVTVPPAAEGVDAQGDAAEIQSNLEANLVGSLQAALPGASLAPPVVTVSTPTHASTVAPTTAPSVVPTTSSTAAPTKAPTTEAVGAVATDDDDHVHVVVYVLLGVALGAGLLGVYAYVMWSRQQRQNQQDSRSLTYAAEV